MSTTVERPTTAPAPALDRPAAWLQVVLAVFLTWSYDELRALHGNVRATAVHHGYQVLRIDRHLGFGSIAALSRWVASHDALADSLSAYYVVMHFGMAALTLLLLWIQGRHYTRYAAALIAINVVGFAVFWLYPVAPPRLLGAGYDDAVRQSLPFAYHAEASAANLYAAVPSLHAAWALWVSAALWQLSRRWWVRVIAVAHSVLTAFTVLATGNHYLFDVLTGFALTAAVLIGVRLVSHHGGRDALVNRSG